MVWSYVPLVRPDFREVVQASTDVLMAAAKSEPRHGRGDIHDKKHSQSAEQLAQKSCGAHPEVYVEEPLPLADPAHDGYELGSRVVQALSGGATAQVEAVVGRVHQPEEPLV